VSVGLLRRLLHKAHTFAALPAFAWAWLLPIAGLLGFSKVLVMAIPFRQLAPYLGVSVGIQPWLHLLNAAQQRRAQHIGRTVRLAASYTPWDSNCFTQAVAARCLLGLYGVPYVLFFGLAKDSPGGHLKAHAWVAAGPVCVTGGAGFGQYSVVGVYAAPALAEP
jgi:hypothetical protein